MIALRTLAGFSVDRCSAAARRLAATLAIAAFTLAAGALATSAGAGEMSDLDGPRSEDMGAPADTPERWSVLDGKVFEGEFGMVGKQEARGTDSWTFQEGMFASENCIECGFPESPYWVAFKEDETTFRASTQCPVSDATITWRGTIEDGRIEGVYTWTKERWYWTIEKEFWFRGTLKDPASDKTVSLE